MTESRYFTKIKERQHGLVCPRCGASAEGTSVFSSQPEKPVLKPGQFVVCVSCGGLNIMTESFASYRAISLRPATRAEEERARGNPDFARIQDAIAKLNQRRKDVQ